MLDSLINKCTKPMLWCLVMPMALLILSLATLIWCYSWKVYQAKEVSIDSSFVKLTAKVEEMQNDIQNTSEFLNKQQIQMKLYSDQLEKLQACNKEPKNSNQQQLSGCFANAAPDISRIISDLKYQSIELNNQKTKLDSVNSQLMNFKQDLKGYSVKYIKEKNK